MLSKALKTAATTAFRDNARREEMTPEDRETAAWWYEQVADETVGKHSGLARLYNLERARFLRGEIHRIAPTAPQFGAEIGYADES